MANEMNKAFENVVENDVEVSATNAAENDSELRSEQLEGVAGGELPPWYSRPHR